VGDVRLAGKAWLKFGFESKSVPHLAGWSQGIATPTVAAGDGLQNRASNVNNTSYSNAHES
jgi:hypothetical protein